MRRLASVRERAIGPVIVPALRRVRAARPMMMGEMTMNDSNESAEVIDSKSRDGITIGMVDAILTMATVLTQRLKSEYRRLDRVRSDPRRDDPWAYHSQAVQDALHDLESNETVRSLLWPRDDEAMAFIHESVKLLKDRGSDDAANRDATP